MVEPATLLQCAVGDHGVTISIMDTGYWTLDTNHTTRYKILDTRDWKLDTATRFDSS